MTDQILLEAMDQKLTQHPHYSSRQLKPSDKELKHLQDFRVTHYAGDVIYNVNGFIEKNKDTLYQDFKRLLHKSRNEYISDMWPEGAQDIKQTTKRPLTAGTLFQKSMIDLVHSINKMEPFYVRCIKPNDIKSPTLFDEELVEHQVRYLGLLENVRVRRAGFVYRQCYDKFLLRYKMISQYTWPNFRSGSDQDGVRVLMEEKGLNNDVRYGHTKIFIRSTRTLLVLEQQRQDMIPHIVILLQKQFRGWIARQHYKKMKACLLIMRAYKTYKLHTYIQTLAHKFKSAKKMRDYGGSIVWPKAPLAGQAAEHGLRRICNNWRAYMILKRYPREQWPQLRLQIIAVNAIKGRRLHWGQKRIWRGDYLAMSLENAANAAYLANTRSIMNIASEDFRKVLFSAFAKKFNKYNKQADRAFIVTDTAIFKLHGVQNKFKYMKRLIPIRDVNYLAFKYLFHYNE